MMIHKITLLYFKISGWNVWMLNFSKFPQRSPKLLNQRITKRYFRTFYTSVIYSQLSPLSVDLMDECMIPNNRFTQFKRLTNFLFSYLLLQGVCKEKTKEHRQSIEQSLIRSNRLWYQVTEIWTMKRWFPKPIYF